MVAILLNLRIGWPHQSKTMAFPEATATEIVHVALQGKRHFVARVLIRKGATLHGGVDEIRDLCA